MTRTPVAARWTARLLVRTDLPVPPLPLVTQTIAGRRGRAGPVVTAGAGPVAEMGPVAGAEPVTGTERIEPKGAAVRSPRPRANRGFTRATSCGVPPALRPLAFEPA